MNRNFSSTQKDNLFAIRGDLDGEDEHLYVEEREQFIGIKIEAEEFYIPISVVSEIVMLQPITYVPQSDKYIEGVINLRGIILPMINLRKMMCYSRCKTSLATRIIIVRYNELSFGILADGITYVSNFLPSEIENQSLPGKSTGVDLISRIAKQKEKVIGILDLQKILLVAGNGKAFEAPSEEE